MKIHIKNGVVVDPQSGFYGQQDVFIAEGKIVALGKCSWAFSAEREVDAQGYVVCPGLVDLSVRLREPGYEYRAAPESEVTAAIAGGVTSLACPPDTDPPLDEPGLVEMLKHRARSLSHIHVYPIGALTVGLSGEKITEMAELSEAGCLAFAQTMRLPTNTEVPYRAMQYAATFGFSVWLQPQDAFLGRKGFAHEGEVASRLGLSAIPASAELIALHTVLQIAQDTGVRLHLTHISSADALPLIQTAREKGVHVTCDMTLNHLHLSEWDIGVFNSHSKLMPPLRSREDLSALRLALKKGLIDALCSDHAPVDDDAKQLPFAEAEVGATGVELLLPLALQWGEEMGLELTKTLAPITINSAKILGVDAGQLAIGADADLCIFDPQANYVLRPDSLKSQGKNTPFLGRTLKGVVRYTLIQGKVVFENLQACH